jgi:UPF0271 protein
MIVVNDTGAIISGLPLRLPTEHYTTSLVAAEVKDKESREILDRMIEIGRLSIVDPSENWLEEAKRVARRAGVLKRLSRADLSVLALALEISLKTGRRVAVATDDYSLQKAVLKAGLEIIRIRYKGVTG